MKYLVVLCLLFLGCTTKTATGEVQSRIEGTITLSPAHGGPSRAGVPNSTPLRNAEFVVEKEDGAVAEFATDAEGRFRISLPPGHYTISLKNKKSVIGRYGPFEVDVAAAQTTKVEWNCDSGMR